MLKDTRALRNPLDEQFLNDFNNRIKLKGEALANEYSEISHALPKRLFYSAVLSPVDPERGPTSGSIEYYHPSNCGLDFTVSENVESINFSVRVAVFSAHYKIDPELVKDGSVLPGIRYVRHLCVASGKLDVTKPHHFETLMSETSKLQDSLNAVSASIKTAGDALRQVHASEVKPITFNPDASGFPESLLNEPAIDQEWSCSIDASVTNESSGRRVQLTLSNTKLEDRQLRFIDSSFYAANIQFEILSASDIVPTALERAPVGDYRYDRSVAASGINCSANLVNGVVETDFSPSFRQNRYLPLTKFDLSFSRLKGDLDNVLTEINSAMDEYKTDWRSKVAIGSLGIQSEDDLKIAESFLATFVLEKSRIDEAIRILRTDEIVRQSFQLMISAFIELNEIRKRRGNREIQSWHMFQFGFILSTLPDLVSDTRSQQTPAHLLWFPTGGGKTEAVMALAVLEMFRDRLRGRTAGVTSWMRFPLRLLTFQQMQRYMDIVVASEIVREEAQKKHPLAGDPFRLGYFGGRNNSPNDLRWIPDSLRIPSILISRLKSSLQRSPSGIDVLLDTEGREYFQELRLVSDCPYCAGEATIGIYGNPESLCLEHRCDSCNKTLPLLIVDEDLYTQLPSILVGTLDKLATIGFKRAFRTIIGRSDGSCAKHGFGVFGKCLKSSFNRCNNSDWKPLLAGASTRGISILFQDELHLLNEQLGCFDGHYESLLMDSCSDTTGVAPLIVAASATIEGAAHQIDHLYGKSVIRFPGEGPTLKESFYAETTEDLQRHFVGLKPFNLAHLDTTMSLATNIYEELAALRAGSESILSQYTSLLEVSESTRIALIDRHSLIVAYVNAKRDGQNIIRSVDEQVRDALERAGSETVRGVEFLSGDTEMDEVKSILKRMNSPRAALEDSEKLDFVAATSMISHGVDVDRLNNMIFFSFPRTTAEYIQASSRSGRSYPGMVYVVLKASTYRDRSFYRNFVSVHSALDRLVETVPIDRFAIHAVERTLPGVALGALLMSRSDLLRTNGISLEDLRTLDDLQTLKRLLIANSGLMEIVISQLRKHYLVDDPRASDWKDQIPVLLRKLSTNIKAADDSRSIPMGLNHTDTRVMTSLRDVEAPLEILVQNRLGVSGTDSDE